ncbi:MAG: hypothetical protein JXB62_12570 [Pirellulales bacterium]|nr:hypothetical protein [Pirellulales bacterium]
MGNQPMYEGKTLIIVLSMHRSGSSMTAAVLQRLGTSLGPFPLLGADPHNKHGHFEAAPLVRLDRHVQRLAFGFSEDVPRSNKQLRRLLARQGRWRPGQAVPEPMLDEGEQWLRGLIESGPVSGFKDPRVPLVWPFWKQVIARLDGLRVVPLFVMRSPHEIAMSMFARGPGKVSYATGLDLALVHMKRMREIRDTWQGDRALVRFDSRTLAEDLRRAAATCGLPWRDDVLDDVYDQSCKHHEPVVVAHEAQAVFEDLAELPSGTATFGKEQLARLQHDAGLRETILQRGWAGLRKEVDRLWKENQDAGSEVERLGHRLQDAWRENQEAGRHIAHMAGEIDQARLVNEEVQLLARQLEESWSQNDRAQRQIRELEDHLAQAREESEQAREESEQAARLVERFVLELAQSREQCHQAEREIEDSRKQSKVRQRAQAEDQRRILQLEAELALIKGSRTWRARNRIMAAMHHLPLVG